MRMDWARAFNACIDTPCTFGCSNGHAGRAILIPMAIWLFYGIEGKFFISRCQFTSNLELENKQYSNLYYTENKYEYDTERFI